jgi:hypothetical protein
MTGYTAWRIKRSVLLMLRQIVGRHRDEAKFNGRVNGIIKALLRDTATPQHLNTSTPQHPVMLTSFC